MAERNTYIQSKAGLGGKDLCKYGTSCQLQSIREGTCPLKDAVVVARAATSVWLEHLLKLVRFHPTAVVRNSETYLMFVFCVPKLFSLCPGIVETGHHVPAGY